MGSGLGKTCGKGHKGQKARAGGYHKVGFEGGQMPLQRRLPKVGFTSMTARYTAEVRLSDLAKVEDGMITLASLKAANIIPNNSIKAKIILNGEITKPVTIKGLKITANALAAVQAAGGQCID
jgi:large subunit ribosomal protein L15